MAKVLKMLQEFRVWGQGEHLLKLRLQEFHVRKIFKPQLHTLQQLQLESAPQAEDPRRHAVCAVFLCAALRCPAVPCAQVSGPASG